MDPVQNSEAAQGATAAGETGSAAAGVAPAPAEVAKKELVLHLTASSAKKIREQIEERAKTKPTAGLRVGVKGGGCSGLSYVIEFCETPRPRDRLFELDGAKVFVDPKSLIYLNGTTLDFVDTFQQKGFKFINPQQKSECGCGESFAI